MTTHDDAPPSSTDVPPGGTVDRPATPIEVAWTEHLSADTALCDRLVIRYRERQRRYHKIGHVEAVLAAITTLVESEAVTDLGAVVAAALYHDAIYEPQHPANERASARLARRDLMSLGWTEERADAVSAMIEGTKTFLDPSSADAAVLNDADLSILGADDEAYRRYAAAIRDEYSRFDDGEWRSGRIEVMQSFLDRDTVYSTATGRQLWEATARRNVSAEIESLRS